MPLMTFFIAVHTRIVLFQCHVAQCLASWGRGPFVPLLNPPLAVALYSSRYLYSIVRHVTRFQPMTVLLIC